MRILNSDNISSIVGFGTDPNYPATNLLDKHTKNIWKTADSATTAGSAPTPGDGNDFTGDANCQALYNLESGALTTDSIGSYTLTNANGVTASSIKKQGSYSADFERSSSQELTITNANWSGAPMHSADATKKISFCAWIRPESLVSGEYYHLMNKYDSSTNERSFLIQIRYNAPNHYLGLSVGYNSGNSVNSVNHASALTAGIWYHVGITFQDSDGAYRLRIWDDNAGAILGTDLTGNVDDNIYLNTLAVRFGGAPSLHFFDGLMDEIVIFNDILTWQEIDQVRQGTYS